MAQDPTSNPYLLAPGTKYFLLEVEPWSSKESSRSRKHSSADKGKRPEERRSVSSGHIRNSRSESSPLARPLSASAVLVDAPSTPTFRRSASTPVGLPYNATDLARSEFAIVEEEDFQGTSPTTMRQPVPQSDEPYSSPPLASPSALALALARSPGPSSSLPRSDPFSDAPFPTSPPLGGPASTAPTTDFEPTHIAAGAFPAFLPSKKTSTNGGSEASSSRYLAPRAPTPKLELASSPTSTAGGSFIAFPRSGGSSGSSILSASMHRRGGSGRTRSTASPPTKALSTIEAQDPGSRWAALTEDLATASTDDFPTSKNGPMTRSTMTIGRNTRGWPGKAAADSGGDSARNSLGSASSIFEAFTNRKSSAPASSPAPSGSEAASEIMKRLKPASPSTDAAKLAGLNGWGAR